MGKVGQTGLTSATFHPPPAFPPQVHIWGDIFTPGGTAIHGQ